MLLFLFMALTFPVSISAHAGHDHGSSESGKDKESSIAAVLPDEVIGQEVILPHLSQITIYMLIALTGIGVGSLATFLLLTATLHPKR